MSQETQKIDNSKTATEPPKTRFKNLKIVYNKIKQNKAAMIGGILILFFIIVAIVGPYLTTNTPESQDLVNKLAPPSAENWFGTDSFGRDIFTRIIYGMSLTLYIGFASVALGATAGVILGLISGYYGRRTDSIIMRIMDVLLAFPGILLALAIVSVLGGSLENVILAVAISSIPVFARIVRGSTLSVKNLEYIDAMKSLGASDTRIIFKHIFPNVTSPIIVQATLSIATAVISASGLSFLGLGAQPPTPEWGAMLADGRNYLYNAWHVAFFPGVMIVAVVLAFNILGDGLRDALDPKIKE
ncbi:peptide/nickel transport system permease protein [Virgibacillus natechei]|uniref:Peptide/nickel transport system permease protein n=1 Tax=Virgibacillus natechei TaxID=1216297 RepID=A0ABS4IKV0_9BACI|nr:ABC transporter permease [Virgibacillus natechei]MBP1970956.1 peptide/nickel transport system permease protein [Virgibacillus natechei]UZD12724.1 ABC transporter permease [Virgibacillus natechei]